MNKMLSWVLASLLLLATGCATVSTQYNTMESMKTYVFDESAATVYEGAVAFFLSSRLPLKSTGENTGVTSWKVGYKSQGSLSHNIKYRYTVATSTVNGNQAIVRVTKETIPDDSDPLNIGKMLGSEMLTPDTMRDISFEFYILKQVNPATAAEMEAAAAK